jgi:hypothetical protein
VSVRWLLLACAVAALAACSAGGSTVSELDGIDDLRAQFNEDAGEPRLILLLSPS